MKFKRTISCLLMVVAVISLVLTYPVKAEAASGQCGSNLKYSFSSGTLTITGSGEFYNMGTTSPPYNRYWSFSSQIKKVVIKANVTSLPSQLFMSCSNLKSVTLPDSITAINSQAFSGCKSLTTINFPKSLTYIGESAFVQTSIKEAIIPEGVTEIKKTTFYQCDKLEKVSFLGTLTDIKESAFYSCDALTTVEFSGAKSMTIGEEAFAYCKNLKDIVFPEGLYLIKDMAFVDCVSLETLDLPESLESLWGSTFRGCDSLTYVTIPKNVDYISNDPFILCDNLQGVTMYAESVAGIKKGMLGTSDSLRYVHIIGDAPTISTNDVFGSRKADEDFVVYFDPDSQGWQLPNWQGYWIEPWGGMEANTMLAGSCGETATWKLENGVLTISGTGEIASYKETGYANEVAPWYRLKNTVHTLVIEEGITQIGTYAFCDMDNLTRVDMADSVEVILNGAFYDCDGLVEAKITENLTRVELDAYGNCDNLRYVLIDGTPEVIWTSVFRNCKALSRVEITEKVTALEASLFTGCENLRTIQFFGDAPEMGEYVFRDVTARVYYPAGNPTWTEEVRGQYGGTVTWVAYTPGEPIGVLGDVSGDGIVDSYDAALIQQYDVGMIPGEGLQLSLADVSGDGIVDSYDAALILQYDVGMIPAFPAA